MYRLISRTFSLHSKKISVIEGDSPSKKIIKGVTEFLKRIDAPLEFEIHQGTPKKDKFDDILESVRKNKVALKGPWTTYLEGTEESLNHAFRRDLDLWCNVVHVKSPPNIGLHSDVDFVIVRQNTEGEYSQIEHESVPGFVEMFKVTTAKRSRQISEFAFKLAVQLGRKSVVCVHKANIMKMGDGLFLSSCRDVASLYPDIEFRDMIVDNASMQLVMRPKQFSVMLLPNLYGSIMISISAGLIGSAGVLAGVNYSENCEIAVFECATRSSGSDCDDPNYLNPTGTLIAVCNLLRHIKQIDFADKLELAVFSTLQNKPSLTPDLGGKATLSQFLRTVEKEFNKQ